MMGQPEPYYQDEHCTIYCGDCREILPELGRFDLLLMDPPYGVNYVTSWRSRNDKLRVPIANDESVDWFSDTWPSLLDHLDDDRHWYVFGSPRMLYELQVICNPKHTIAWDKGDRGTVGDLTCGFGEAWEAILYGMKGRRPLNGKRPRTVIRYDWSSAMDPLHPTVKPVPLLQRLISMSTNGAETVLDPFAGSCTTGVAAKLEGRKSVLIEINERYCEIGANRLAQGVLF